MDATSLIRPRWLLSAVAVALVLVVSLMLNDIGHAGPPTSAQLPEIGGTQCIFPDATVCISLDPETDSNDTGTNHTVTASVTLNDEPFPPGVVEVAIIVFDGPNTFDDPDNLDALTTGAVDENGQVSLTYAGDGGPGTDTIGAVGCIEPPVFIDGASEASGGHGILCGVAIGSFIDLCLDDQEACLIALTSSEGLCALQEVVICDTATKEWVEPTPVPSASPTATPVEAAPAAELPATGSYPTGGSGSPLAGTMALALGGLAILAGGVALVRRSVAT